MFRTAEFKKAEKYMFVSTSPVGMLNVKVGGIGIFQETFKNSNWKSWEFNIILTLIGSSERKRDKLMHRLEID